MGIRIEDDIFVSSNGPIILSAEAPKEITDIEHLMLQN
jgi:Xaa-Pro aminopeptidase